MQHGEVSEPESDWERRYRASIESEARRTVEVEPNWSRRLDPFVRVASAWWSAWLLLGGIGLAARALGLRIPAVVGAVAFPLVGIGIYVAIRRESRRTPRT